MADPDFQAYARAAIPYVERFAGMCERHIERGTPGALAHETRSLGEDVADLVPRETLERVLAALAVELRKTDVRRSMMDDFGRHVAEAEARVSREGGAPTRVLELLRDVDVGAPGFGAALCAAEFDPRTFGMRSMRAMRPLAQLRQSEEPEHVVAMLLDVAKTTIETSYTTLARVLMRVDEARQGFAWAPPGKPGAIIQQAALRFPEINGAAVFYRNAEAHEEWDLALDQGVVRLSNNGKARDVDLDDLSTQVMQIFEDGFRLLGAYNAYSLGLWYRTGAFERALDSLANTDPSAVAREATAPLDVRPAMEKLRALRRR